LDRRPRVAELVSLDGVNATFRISEAERFLVMFGQLRRGSGKPRLVYPGARLAREEASTPVAMSW
jgi:hypothetical protein